MGENDLRIFQDKHQMQEKCLLLSSISLFGGTCIQLETLSAICQKYYIRIVVFLCTYSLFKSTHAHTVQQSLPWGQSHRCVSTSHSKSILSFTLSFLSVLNLCVGWVNSLSHSWLFPHSLDVECCFHLYHLPIISIITAINSTIYNPILRTHLSGLIWSSSMTHWPVPVAP